MMGRRILRDPTACRDEIAANGWSLCGALGIRSDADTLALASKFGTPISYCEQPVIMDVRPAAGHALASYAGIGEFALHTDCSWHEHPPRFIVMICLQVDQLGGGIPRLADGWAAIDKLSSADRKVLETSLIRFSAPSHINLQGTHAPVAVREPTGFRLRFRGDLMVEGIPDAVRQFQSAVDTVAFNLPIEAGEAYVLDNHRMLHGRTALDARLLSNRHFKRVYVT